MKAPEHRVFFQGSTNLFPTDISSTDASRRAILPTTLGQLTSFHRELVRNNNPLQQTVTHTNRSTASARPYLRDSEPDIENQLGRTPSRRIQRRFSDATTESSALSTRRPSFQNSRLPPFDTQDSSPEATSWSLFTQSERENMLNISTLNDPEERLRLSSPVSSVRPLQNRYSRFRRRPDRNSDIEEPSDYYNSDEEANILLSEDNYSMAESDYNYPNEVESLYERWLRGNSNTSDQANSRLHTLQNIMDELFAYRHLDTVENLSSTESPSIALQLNTRTTDPFVRNAAQLLGESLRNASDTTLGPSRDVADDLKETQPQRMAFQTECCFDCCFSGTKSSIFNAKESIMFNHELQYFNHAIPLSMVPIFCTCLCAQHLDGNIWTPLLCVCYKRSFENFQNFHHKAFTLISTLR